MKPVGQRGDGVFADVVLVDAAYEVVEETFSKCPVGNLHVLYAKGIEGATQDGQPAGKGRVAAGVQVGEAVLVYFSGAEKIFNELVESLAADAIFAPASGFEYFADGAYASRGTEGFVPFRSHEEVFEGFELLLGKYDGFFETFCRDFAICEISHASGDAAHGEAFLLDGGLVDSDDEFGAAAADVHDEATFAVGGEVLGDSLVDEAGFFDAGDDFNGMSKGLFGQFEEWARVFGESEGVGAYCPDIAQGDMA